MGFGYGEADECQTGPVRGTGTVVVLCHVHVGVRVADRERAGGGPHVVLGLPPAEMAEDDAFDHSPGQGRGQVDVGVGEGSPEGDHGEAVAYAAAEGDGAT